MPGQADNNNIKDVAITVLLKSLSKFWRTHGMPLINCKSNLILSWSANRGKVYTSVANQGATFAKTDTKVIDSSCNFINSRQEKLLDQLKSGFKRTINCNKDQSIKINSST